MVASEITISKLIKEKYIKLELEQKDKKKVLAELVDLVASSGKVKDKKNILQIILKREKLGSTGIGHGVAIPHARSPKVTDFVLAFGRSSEGIDFGALDGARTQLFFMLVSPENNVGGHLKILAEISGLVRDKFIVERLRLTRDKKEILKILAQHEK